MILTRFFVVPANDALRIRRVHKQGLLLCHRVDGDDWVYGFADGSTQHRQVTVVADLSHDWVCCRVNCVEALESFPERRGKSFESATHLVYHVSSGSNCTRQGL